MGCGCKNQSVGTLGTTENTNFNRLKFYLDNDKFSLFGLLKFLLITPLLLFIIPPIMVTILFKTFVFGQNIDITKHLFFTKDKKKEK